MASPAYSHCDTPSSRKRRRGLQEYDEMYDMSEDEVHPSDDSESDGPASLVNEEMTDITLPEHNNARAPAFEPELKEIEPALRVPVDKIEPIMAKHRYNSPQARQIRVGAKDLRQPLKRPHKNITFRGETGTCKSSTLNSLVDILKLAQAVAAGRRGTNVPFVYRRPLQGQTMRYAAQIVFMSKLHATRLLRKWLNDYYAWRQPTLDNLADEEQYFLRQKGITALSILMALRSNETDFSSEQNAHSWLAAQANQSANSLIQLCDSRLPVATAIDTARVTKVLIQANTPELLMGLLRQYSDSTPCAERASLWPLVDRIRVGIQGRAILEYASLVDPPGSGDSDLLRANAHERLYDNCSEVWIFAWIGRITSNEVVTRMVHDCCRVRLKPVMIATRADEDIGDELERARYSGQDVGRLDQCLQNVRQLTTEKEQLRQDLRKIQHRRGESNRRKRAALEERKKAVEALLHPAQQERVELLVHARNGSVAEHLANEYDHYLQHLPGTKLEVYGVANAHYAMRREDTETALPLLPLASTGPPSLRKYIYDGVAPLILQQLEEYIENKYMPYIAALSIYVDPIALKGPETVLSAVDDATTEIKEILSAGRDQLTTLVSTDLSKPLLAPDSRRRYRVNAISVLNSKKSLHGRTQRASFKKHGNHTANGGQEEPRNQQFAQPAIVATLQQPGFFWTQHKALAASIRELLLDHIRGIMNRIGDAVMGPSDLQKFNRYIAGRARAAIRCCAIYKVSVDQATTVAERLVHLQSNGQNYFTRAMKATWDECNQGQRSIKQSFETLERSLELENDLSPFVGMIRNLETDILTNVVRAPLEPLENDVQRILVGIREWVSTTSQSTKNRVDELALRLELKPVLEEMEQAASDQKAILNRLVQTHRVPQAVMRGQ
ncbi:hypothetical protein LTR10_010367 [Elasticomyces elasticus]|nr:hypothetical protein LTR10_010367 [Elasticomyces elasticus]KAK4972269.1 hypothetical protein LTR42_006776 [Elasticomyces elasticus]